jgi:hypothetical protein
MNSSECRSRDLRQKYAHGFGVCRRQHQRVQHAVVWTHGRKGIVILTYNLHLDNGPHSGRSPASPRVTDPPKTSFILKHEANGPLLARGISLRRYLLLDDLR